MVTIGGKLEVLTPTQVRDIHLASLEVLERTGVVVPHRPLLEILCEVGASVDFQGQRAFFPPYLVEEMVRKAPPRFTWHGRNPKYDIKMEGDRVHFIGASTLVTVVDLEGFRRPATLQDAKDISRLKDGLPYIHDGYCSVHPRDVPDGAAHAYMMHAQFANSEKPYRGRMFGTSVARDCIRMAEVVAGGPESLRRQPNILSTVNTVSPLSNSPDQMEAMVEHAKHGLPLVVAPEIQAGATGPVTLAGVLVQQNAEILSTITMIQLVNPGNPVVYGTVSSVFDMKKAMLPYATAEACLINVASAQMARYYQLPSRGTGGYTDANVLDMQAGFETGLTILMATLAGINHILGAGGSIEQATTASYEKFVIDNEINGIISRITRGIEVTDETMAVEVIHNVGPKGHFLGQRHTYDHFRAEHFFPELSNRDRYEIWKAAGSQQIHELARAKARQILQEHRPPPLAPEVEAELFQIIKEVEARLERS